MPQLPELLRRTFGEMITDCGTRGEGPRSTLSRSESAEKPAPPVVVAHFQCTVSGLQGSLQIHAYQRSSTTEALFSFGFGRWTVPQDLDVCQIQVRFSTLGR